VARAVSHVRYQIDSVSVQFATADGPRQVLRDVSFEVRAGEILGIVGRSGVGKTTLLRALGGLVTATRGTVVFDGDAVRGPPAGVVMVFQDYGNALLPWRTVGRNTALGLEGHVGPTSAAAGWPRRCNWSVCRIATASTRRGSPAAWRSECRSPGRWRWRRRCC